MLPEQHHPPASGIFCTPRGPLSILSGPLHASTNVHLRASGGERDRVQVRTHRRWPLGRKRGSVGKSGSCGCGGKSLRTGTYTSRWPPVLLLSAVRCCRLRTTLYLHFYLRPACNVVVVFLSALASAWIVYFAHSTAVLVFCILRWDASSLQHTAVKRSASSLW